MLMRRQELESLIPHAGTMCLLDTVESWDETRIHCSSRGHLSPRHPLLRNGRLSALHGCEYGAQAMAVHGGLLARADGQPPPAGYLAALRQVRLNVLELSNISETLQVYAERVHAEGGNLIYRFRLMAGESELLSGQATVMPPPKASS